MGTIETLQVTCSNPIFLLNLYLYPGEALKSSAYSTCACENSRSNTFKEQSFKSFPVHLRDYVSRKLIWVAYIQSALSLNVLGTLPLIGTSHAQANGFYYIFCLFFSLSTTQPITERWCILIKSYFPLL